MNTVIQYHAVSTKVGPNVRPRLERAGGHSRAFTLIELLVVVAIIALLVAILVPALQQAREITKLTVCLSNLRQIITAAHMYTAANGDLLPGYIEPPGGLTIPQMIDWVRLQSDWPTGYSGASPANGDYYAYLHDLYMIGGNSTADNNPSTGRPNPRKLNIYVEHAEKVFRCPSDQGAVNVQPQTAEDQVPLYDRPDWTGTGSMGSSYMYNASPGWYGPDHILSGRRIWEFKNPSRQVVIGDATMLRTWHHEDAPYPLMIPRYNLVYTWHDLPSKHTGAPLADDPQSTGERILDYDARGNAAFADGHAETVLFKKQFITNEYIMYDPN